MRSLVVLLVLVGSTYAQTPELASVRIYKYGGRDTEALNNDELPDGLGSGWLITPTQVVTAYHVVRNNRGGNKQLEIRFSDGWRSWGTVESVDTENDIALIWINAHKTILPIPMGKTPEKGDVTIYGYGYDYEFVDHVGSMMPERLTKKYGDSELAQGDVKIDNEGPWNAALTVVRRGDSGGPVMYEQKCVGSVLSIGDTFSVFVRIETIQKSFKSKLRHSVLGIK